MARSTESASIIIRNPECERCGICGRAHTVCLSGDGDPNCGVMLVGEAPGGDEDLYGVPFVGLVGRFLKKRIFPAAGVSEGDVFLTNAARCWPVTQRKGQKGKTRRPKAPELRNCRSYLEQEIKWMRPKVILAMGNAPMASLLHLIYKSSVDDEGKVSKEGKVSGITKWQGKKIWSREFRCWIIPTFHPSYARRGYKDEGLQYAFDLIVADLEEAMMLAEQPLPKYRLPEITVIDDTYQMARMLNEMHHAGTFAFDTETGGKGRLCDKYVIGCSFACSSKHGYYVDWEWLKANGYYYEAVRRLLSSNNYTKIMHNGAYDIGVLKYEGIDVYDDYKDTMMAAHMVDENFGKSLKDLSWLHTSFGGYDTPLERYKTKHKIKEDYSQIPHSMRAPYGALDAVATYILWEKFRPVLKREKSLVTFEHVVMPVRRVMCASEHYGMRVNLEYAQDLHDRCNTAYDKLEKQVYEAAGKEFNINSPKQLAEVLYTDLGYDYLKQTKTGYSVDADSIAHVASQGCDMAQALLDRSYLKTMKGTHISQAIRFVWRDGRIHTSYNMTGAVSGRTTCSKPGIHNVPRDRLVRTMYIASEGHLLVEEDLRSAELAYLAAESGEEVFLHAFAEGLDLHLETAKIIFNKSNPTVEERHSGKTINFAVIYGMTIAGLAKKLKITEEEAEEFIESYFARLPKVLAYMERCKEQVRERGWVESLFHYRRRLPMGMSDNKYDIARAERQAMNSPIQNGAALYTYIGLSRLWRALKRNYMKSKIIHTVHDCGIIDAPRPEVKKVRELSVLAFESPIKVVPVRMQIETTVSKAWGESNEESRLYDILDGVGLADGLPKAKRRVI